MIAYPIENGTIQPVHNWKANEQLKNKSAASRVIFTMDSDGSKRVFSEPSVLTGSGSGLSQAQITALLAGYPISSSEANKLPYVKALVNYLRGDTTYEDESTTVPGWTPRSVLVMALWAITSTPRLSMGFLPG